VLTTINLALPTLVLVVFIGLRFGRAPVLDWVAPVIFWLWLAASPVVGGMAVRGARRDGAKRLVWLNIVVLALWAVLLLGALLLH
jgi:chromate transport protein ChrA